MQLSADLPVHGGGELTNGDLVLQNKEDIAHQLEKEHHNYWTQTHYLYEKLNALQSEVNDFKSEGRGGKREGGSASGEEGSEAGRRESGGEIQKSQEIPRKLHATVVRQSSHKHYAYDKVLINIQLCMLFSFFLFFHRANLDLLNRELNFLKICNLFSKMLSINFYYNYYYCYYYSNLFTSLESILL